MSCSYCDYLVKKEAEGDQSDRFHLHKQYHDMIYGRRLGSSNDLFGRLILEIMQAGLNWTVVLRKQDGIRTAFDDFDIEKIASYEAADRERLLNDDGIIRNRLKIDAIIHNARIIVSSGVGFEEWLLDQHSSRSLDVADWLKIFKNTGFRFVGKSILEEFLRSSGFLPSHIKSCPVYDEVLATNPPWYTSQAKSSSSTASSKRKSVGSTGSSSSTRKKKK